MRKYEPENPEFSESIEIPEQDDPAHADLLNKAPEQLLQDILVIASALKSDVIEQAFNGVFSIGNDSTAMTYSDVNNAISTKWNGESSDDSEAMSSTDVNESIETQWDGSTSGDDEAITADEISGIIS